MIAAIALGWALFGMIWQPLVVGLVVSLAAQGGDLIESALKRSSGAKDSSTYLPGLGGALDVLDSMVLSLPAGAIAIELLFDMSPCYGVS